ncbi:MAG: synthase subunit gamma [Pseudomonadota bacterium]|jgi:F-type H+-transporting ATPase subunit gamma
MGFVREIRSKIKSVQSTEKITSAMQKVAASKMHRAQERMRASRPFAHQIHEVITHLAAASLEDPHPYLVERPVKNIGVIVVSSDRGLCGGMNINLFKSLITFMKEWKEKEVDTEICVFGKKAEQFFKTVGGKVVSSVTGLGDKPVIQDLIGSVRVMLTAYAEGRIDRLYLVYNQFVNTMTQKAKIDQLIPAVHQPAQTKKHRWDYLYEPNAQALLDTLLIRYIESLVYQGVVENGACEQAARMIAMKNASDNAQEIIGDLKLMYNKARQAAITRELSEIVAGAAAV